MNPPRHLATYGRCASMFREMSDAGVSCGICRPAAWPPLDGAGVCPDAVHWIGCGPGSHVETITDDASGGIVDQWFCCGNGPPCACDELCWSPNATEAPHCIPNGRDREDAR